MVNAIRIIEIEIKNYRQYRDKQLITFPDRSDGFSVIIGDNGAGKSNILNAINWCFYQKEPHQSKNKGKMIINEKYLESLDNGKIGTMSVKVKLKKDDTEYHISRILAVTKNKFQHEQRLDGKVLIIEDVHGYILPKGTDVLYTQSTFEIMKKEKHETNFFPIEGLPYTLMNEILPEVLSPYFLLDGEYLEKFWEDLSRVKTGVEQIAQLNLLTSASEHLSLLKTNIPKIGSSAIDSLTNEINVLEFWEKSCDKNGDPAWSKEMRFNYDPSVHPDEHYHLSGMPRIIELEQDIGRMKSRLTEISQAFAKSNVQIVTELNNTEQKLSAEFENKRSVLADVRKKFLNSQIHNGPIFFLKPAFETVALKVNALRIKGELPYEAKMIFTKDLLELGKCICHADLTSKLDSYNEETNESRKNVEDVRNQMENDQGLDYALEMVGSFNSSILNDPAKFTSDNFENIEKNYHVVKKEINRIRDELGDVRLKLQSVGVSDVDELTKDHRYVLDTLTESQKMIDTINSKIKDNHRILGELRTEQNTLLSRDSRSKKIAFEQNIWLKISKIMDDTLSSIKEEIRTQVQEKTFKIFLETMYKEEAWDRFTIDEHYSAELYSDNFSPSLGSMSAGERLFLTFSFIAALKEITGYRFPLVIDTPLGRVSAKPRYLLSQALPKFLPDDQIFFLATGTEFLEPLLDWDKDDPKAEGFPEIPFAQLLEESIKMNYWSIRTDQNMATIQSYIPMWRKNNA